MRSIKRVICEPVPVFLYSLINCGWYNHLEHYEKILYPLRSIKFWRVNQKLSKQRILQNTAQNRNSNFKLMPIQVLKTFNLSNFTKVVLC